MDITALTDLKITDSGDLYLDNKEDLYYAGGLDSLVQAAFVRLKTELEDCKLWPEFGHTMRAMIGKRFSKDNINILKTKIYSVLTQGNLFDKIVIETLPTNNTDIFIYCNISINNIYNYKVSFSYDFANTYMSEIKFEKI